jgi:hypothetical protein
MPGSGGEMWQKIYLVWLHLGYSGIMPFTALALLLDGITGLSRRLTWKLKMERHGDLLLLGSMIVLSLAGWWLFFHLDNQYLKANFIATTDNPGARERDAVWADLALPYEKILKGIVLASAIAGPILAYRKGRSVFQWIGLSLLGNAGALLWLLLAPKKVSPHALKP